MKINYKHLHTFNIFILVLAAIASHWYVFFDLNYLNAGDWIHVPNNLLIDLQSIMLWGSHVDLGKPIVVANNLPFYWLSSFLYSYFPVITWDIFVRIFFFLPIIIFTPLTSYSFFKSVVKKPLPSFFATLMYVFNPFFLRLGLDWLTYAYMWWILPLLLLVNQKSLRKLSIPRLLLNTLIVFLGFVVEIRIMIVIMSILIFKNIIDILFTYKNKNELFFLLKRLFITYSSYLVGVGLHLFWLYPFVSGFQKSVLSYASPQPFLSFYSVLDAISLRPYQWSNFTLGESFIIQPIQINLILIVFLVIFGLSVSEKVLTKKFHFISLILFLVSITLIKQESEPFGEIYTFLFNYLPLFKLFRESSKFFILAAIPMSLFFGIGVQYLIKYGKNFTSNLFLSVFLSILLLSNTVNFLTQDVGRMAKGVLYPSEFQSLNEQISSENERYRILWIPKTSRWAPYTFNNPKTSFANLVNSHWSEFKPEEGTINPILHALETMITTGAFKNYLEYSNIKYIIVPQNLDHSNDNIFRYYAQRELFIAKLSALDYLLKLEHSDLDIWEVSSPQPYLIQKREYTEDEVTFPIDFKLANRDEFIFELDTSTNSKILLSESFNQGWKLSVENELIEPENNDYGLISFTVPQTCSEKCNNSATIFFSPNNNMNKGIELSLKLFSIYLIILLLLWRINEK